MTRASNILVVACLVAVPACLANKESKGFSIDPARRGFEMPARPVILFFVDGLRADVLGELELRGELPRLQRYLFDRAAHVHSAVTSVPSVTYANAVTMLTGRWPSKHGVWANDCFDRQHLLTRNYEAQREYAATDDSCATIFELMSDELTAGVALPFERGVKISRAKSAKTGGMAFGLSWFTGQKEAADELLSEQFYDIGEQARRIGEWPAFIAIHLPAVDNVGHEHGSDGEEYRSAVASLDQAIGEVLEAFDRGAVLQELTIVLTSDHGHHSTRHSLALEEYLPAALGEPVLVSLENDGGVPFIERWGRYSPVRVVVTPNGVREASVHLRTSADWNDRPNLEEILAFPSIVGEPTPQSLPDKLLQCPGIDLVAVRAGEHEVHVYGRRGAAVIERTSRSDEPSFGYKLLSGGDPLGYDADDRLREWIEADTHTSREWLAATADQRFPDLVPQLVTAFDDSLSGDLILFAAPTWDFSEHYIGGHGGVEREEMIVPLYLAGPGIRAGAELPTARLVDIVPTLLELAGVDVPASQRFDGVSLVRRLR